MSPERKAFKDAVAAIWATMPVPITETGRTTAFIAKPKPKKPKQPHEKFHKKPEEAALQGEIMQQSQTLYTVAGTNIMLSNDMDKPPSLKNLPVGMYSLSFHPDIGYYLTMARPFELPEKIYGNTVTRAERFLQTFESRSSTTGILLAGEKGSGKSLELKTTCVLALKRGVSVIIIDMPACGPAFNKFVSQITDPCILVFDEFEKVYEEEQQKSLLTLLDGTYNSKKMCIFTVNEKNRVNAYMINRPGRMFYYLEYKGLELAFIREYCEDRLDDKTKIDSVCRASAFFSAFNFDMLQALVEELNRYPKDTVKDALAILNIKMDYQARTYYKVALFKNDEQIPDDQVDTDEVINPLYQEVVGIEFTKILASDKKGRSKSDHWETVEFDLKNPDTTMDKDVKEIVAFNGDYRLVLTKPEPKTYMKGDFAWA